MDEKVIVAVDAMGGDHAPYEIIKGALEAAQENEKIIVKLVGQEEVVKKHLEDFTYREDQVQVVDAREIIETEEPPVNAIRKKKDSSLVVAMNMVKNKEADALVSAGSSGAILVGGQVIVGRIKGIERPPLAPLIPTSKGYLYGKYCGSEKSKSCHCQYRGGGGEGQCTCKRNLSSFKGVYGY